MQSAPGPQPKLQALEWREDMPPGPALAVWSPWPVPNRALVGKRWQIPCDVCTVLQRAPARALADARRERPRRERQRAPTALGHDAELRGVTISAWTTPTRPRGAFTRNRVVHPVTTCEGSSVVFRQLDVPYDSTEDAMPDPYAFIAQADESIQTKLAGVLELRAADPQQRAMLDAYLSEINLPSGAIALDVGCGTGAVTRALAALPGVGQVVGLDPSPIFLEKARELAKALPQTSFREGDARAVPFADASVDLVLFHTTLCHVPNPEKALLEAHRVLRPGGLLAVFDGDYVATTVAIDTFDPLQRAVDAMVANFVQNPWLTRRLGPILGSIGFTLTSLRSHGYTQTTEPQYMLTIVDRGVDVLAGAGVIGAEQAEGLKSEARRRVKVGAFFGHISYISVIARKQS
jgi:ubiquinone/menaquinone biosynthesis C-methylase UbiE